MGEIASPAVGRARLAQAAIGLSMVAMALCGQGLAWAQDANEATVHIDDTTPRPGQTVRITGTCATHGAAVVVYSDNPVEDRTGSDRVDLARTSADADGTFDVTGTIPSDLDPTLSIDGRPPGTWLIVAQCTNENGLAEASVIIRLDGSGAPNQLANTGAAVAPLALLAVAAIAAGTLLREHAAVARRRSG
jgi:hypothetical protein